MSSKHSNVLTGCVLALATVTALTVYRYRCSETAKASKVAKSSSNATCEKGSAPASVSTPDAARPRITELWVYPVKSCKGICLQACDITKRGLKYDREFMVVDDKGKFVSQRTKPRMALIETSIDWQRDVLTLKAPGAPTMQIHLRESDPAAEKSTFDVNVWGDHCDAFEVSEECSCWFNIVLECTNLRLVRMQPTFVRETDIDYAPEGQAGFADGFAFLLATQESLDDLNKRLAKPVNMLNFRPNIVVEGGFKPFEEDFWKEIEFASSDTDAEEARSIEMKVVKPCSRCKMPTVDPALGVFDESNQPTRTMATFRTGAKIGFDNKKWSGEVFFGQNLDHGSRETGCLKVGDVVVAK